jgi:hypothetical protein
MMKRYAAAIALVLGLAAAGCSHAPESGGAASKYETQLVRRGGSSVEDAKVYLVQGGRKRWIVNGSWIKAHGYAWPSDVHVIPAADLSKIPDGAPITEGS